MKCAVALSVLLAASSLLLGDSPSPSPSPRQPSATLLDELVRMTRAGSSDRAVLAYAQAHRAELPSEVSAASLRWLRDSGVSDVVVRYMSAFDVRIPTDEPMEEAGGDEGGAGRYALSDSSGYGYPYAESQPYADYGYGYADYGYGYGYYPYFGYPYFYSPFVVIGRAESFRRHSHSDHRDHHMDHGDHRDHRDQGNHRFDGGHRENAVNRGGSRDAWRERGVRPGRAGSTAPGTRGPARPALTRGFGSGAQPVRGHGVSPRSFGAPGPAHANLAQSHRGPRGGVPAGGGFRSFAPAGAPHSGAAGGSGRGPAGPSGGGRGRH